MWHVYTVVMPPGCLCTGRAKYASVKEETHKTNKSQLCKYFLELRSDDELACWLIRNANSTHYNSTHKIIYYFSIGTTAT